MKEKGCIFRSEAGRKVAQWFLSVDPLASEFVSWSPFSYSFNNPVRFIDPDGRAPEDIIYRTVRDNKTGATTLYVTVNAKIINLSSSSHGVSQSLVNSIKSKAKSAFSGNFRYGGGKEFVDVKFELNLSVANNENDIGKDDHVIAIVDRIPQTEDINLEPAGRAEMDGNIAAIENSLGSITAPTAIHELGHNLGLDDNYKKTGNVMGDIEHAGKNPTTTQQDRMLIFAPLAHHGKEEKQIIRNMGKTKGNSKTQLFNFLDKIEAEYQN